MWLLCFDRAGVIVSGGFNFITHLPFLAALLAILQRFNEEDWGHHAAFSPCDGTNGEKNTYNVELSPVQQTIKSLTINIDARKTCPPHNLFSRATSVCPTTFITGNELAQNNMVAKISYPDATRMSEVDILLRAYKVADLPGEDGSRVRGHLPTLIAYSNDKPSLYADLIGETLKRSKTVDKIRRRPRILRILLFVELRPISNLSDVQFMKAFWDCFLCTHFTFSPWPVGIHELTSSDRPRGAMEA